MIVKELVDSLLKFNQNAIVEIIDYEDNPLDGNGSEVESVFEIRTPIDNNGLNAVYIQKA